MEFKKFATGILIGLCPVVLSGMARSIDRDLSQHPSYSAMIGKEYKTKNDLLIYRYQGTKDLLLDQYGVGQLPNKEQMKEKFPFSYYSVIVEGIAPAGSVFKIKRVKLEGNSDAAFIYFYADLVSIENKKKSRRNFHLNV